MSQGIDASRRVEQPRQEAKPRSEPRREPEQRSDEARETASEQPRDDEKGRRVDTTA